MVVMLRQYSVILAAIGLIITGSAVAYAQQGEMESISTPIREALTTFYSSIAAAAPRVIAASILLLIGFIAGKVVGRVVENIAKKILQRTTERSGTDITVVENIAGTEIRSSQLIAATVRWFVYLFFIVAAINALQFAQLSDPLAALWLWIPNILAFILIIIIGFIIMNFVTKWIETGMKKENMKQATYIVTPVKVVIVIVIFAIALTQLGIGQAIIPILVSAFAWSIAIAIGAAIAAGLGFALKDIIPAAIAGASHQRVLLKEGDRVTIGEITGKVESVELLYVKVKTSGGEIVIIPSREVATKSIKILPSP